MPCKVIYVSPDTPLPAAKRGVEYRYPSIAATPGSILVTRYANGKLKHAEMAVPKPTLIVPKRGTKITLPSFISRARRPSKRFKRWQCK